MIFSNTSNYMLKYQKAKAKLVEYDIPQKDYPKFPLNSNELSYPVVYILSRYAESVIENNVADMEEFSPHLVAASQYFDAAVGANDREEYDADFLLSGAAAYFLSDDFGSAKVLCSDFFVRINPEINEPQKITGNLLGYLLLNRDFHISVDTPNGEKVCHLLLVYYNTGEGVEEIRSLLSEYRKAIYENDAPMEIYYVDILCAIVMVALSKSSWILLPRYSELDQSLWSDYLKSPKAPRMLWPAQQLIGEKGVLRGQSAIVQLPTGVGKTKSIELVIRSSFASGRATTAIIVAPLRALCNEIANDMISAFGDKVLVNQFSDVLEEDFSLDLFLSLKSKILICTPEKLSYIIHHQADFLDEIGLYIFDEGHMFDDGSRGAIYELLISEIRSHISLEEQLILLSAVLSNAEQIQKWLLGEAGVLASDPQIKATPKTIGFASQTKDIHYYSDDSAQEDFYVPRSIEVIALQKRPREKKQRYFPELTDAKDIAIYYANKLCKNGAAAIFANRTSTVLTVINRIIELRNRGHDLAEIKGNSDGEEMNRLAQLMSSYYGEQHPYTIYDKGPVKRFLMEHGIPHTKSGPLNITKAANINSAWAERRDSSDIANCVIDVVSYLESHNLISEIQEIGVSLIKKLLREAKRIQELSVEVKPSTDPDYISDLCIKLIDNVPDSGNTPQQIASKLLKYYHLSMHSEIRVTGGDDRASVTSTTSNKPGDVNEEWCNRILKVYEITVKPFDEERIIDSYDCIEKFNQHSEQQIREVIVICRPKDCPNQIRTSGLSFYLGSIDHQNVRYYFWNIYEWVVSMLQKMPDEGKEFFLRSLNCYINDANTSEAVKIEWRKLHNIE